MTYVMETVLTGDYLLVGMVAFSAVLLYMGYKTGARIYNLFAVGVFIYLGILLSEIVPLVIVIVGIILYQLYYTFFGRTSQ